MVHFLLLANDIRCFKYIRIKLFLLPHFINIIVWFNYPILSSPTRNKSLLILTYQLQRKSLYISATRYTWYKHDYFKYLINKLLNYILRIFFTLKSINAKLCSVHILDKHISPRKRIFVINSFSWDIVV